MEDPVDLKGTCNGFATTLFLNVLKMLTMDKINNNKCIVPTIRLRLGVFSFERVIWSRSLSPFLSLIGLLITGTLSPLRSLTG